MSATIKTEAKEQIAAASSQTPENVDTEMTKEQMQASLEAAIAKHRNADVPGEWSVSADDNSVQLIWSCEESAAPEMYGDEPWSEWGGDEIIESAGIGCQDDAGCDQYQKWGSTILEQWAQWKI